MRDGTGAVERDVKVAAVIPAYNEEPRIRRVLEAAVAASLVDEVLVVSDGSTDGTYRAALEIPGVRAVELGSNRGKAAAMCEGALCTDADVLVFLDADLSGLKPEHVDALARPVVEGRADMCVGVFRGGRLLTDLAQKIAPVISGQRAIRRDLFLAIPDLPSLRMGVEIALTRWARWAGIRVSTTVIGGVTHSMKEEKLGPVRGLASRIAMYADIGRVMMDGRKLREQARALRALRGICPREEESLGPFARRR